MSTHLTKLIQEFVRKYGEDKLVAILEPAQNEGKILTIVADPTMHKIPDSLILGDGYVFSSMSLDPSSERALQDYLEGRIEALVMKLKSDNWTRVRVIFSGHAILPAVIKMTVYRVCHIETEDVVYFGGFGYRSLSINTRRLISQLGNP